MLRTLTVRDYAIIDRVDIELGRGLNVLTGETGAGKSIIVDALGLVLGDRADAAMVRSGSQAASVDAVFDVSRSGDVERALAEMDLRTTGGSLRLSREVSPAGKSIARIIGKPASLSQLKLVGDELVDLHGQHEHQSLLSVPRHLGILDEWAGVEVATLRGRASEKWRRLQALIQERDALLADARDRDRTLELCRFQAEEIAQARVTPGEDAELERDVVRAANMQKLAEAASSASEAISSEEGRGAADVLAGPLRALEEAAALDTSLAPLCETIRSATYELAEAARDLHRYREGLEVNPGSLEQLEDRLDVIRTLKRKYGGSVESVLAYLEDVSRRIDALERSDERGAELEAEVSQARGDYGEVCARLTGARRAAAGRFGEAVTGQLRDLAMEKARFSVQLDSAPAGPAGVDAVEFLIAANPGEPVRPLSRVASGGEISRVMLAIKSAMASDAPLPTMVFDEIDIGVGGRTAEVIADRLAQLARSAQVICITHLAQIAARGERHFAIGKTVTGGRTRATVKLLGDEERVGEIARMIGGSSTSAAVLQHAREMLARA